MLYGITIHDSYVIAESKVLYWDKTIKYFRDKTIKCFSKQHLPYAVAAILILIIYYTLASTAALMLSN